MFGGRVDVAAGLVGLAERIFLAERYGQRVEGPLVRPESAHGSAPSSLSAHVEDRGARAHLFGFFREYVEHLLGQRSGDKVAHGPEQPLERGIAGHEGRHSRGLRNHIEFVLNSFFELPVAGAQVLDLLPKLLELLGLR